MRQVPRQAKTALGLLVCMNLLNLIDRQILAAVVPMIRQEFFTGDAAPNWFIQMLLAPLTRLLGASHPENAMIGLLGMAFMISYTLGAPLFGALKVRRWWLISAAVIAWSLATGAVGLATTFGGLLLARCLVGFSESAFAPVAPTIIADHFPVSVRGRAMPLFYLAIPLGSALGFVVAGQIAASFGWRWVFFLAVPPGIVLGLLALWMREPVSLECEKAQVLPRGISRWQIVRSLSRNRSFVLDTLGETAMTFAIGGMVFWVPSYITEFRQAGSLAQVNLIFGGIVVVAGTSATILGALLAERLKPRMPGSYFIVSAVAMLIGFPIFIAALYVPFPYAWIFMFLAVFCLLANTGPANTILANVTHPSIRTVAFAVNIFTIHAFGDVISPLVIGAVADATDMNTAFLMVGFFFLAGGAFWLAGARYLAGDTERALACDLAAVLTPPAQPTASTDGKGDRPTGGITCPSK